MKKKSVLKDKDKCIKCQLSTGKPADWVGCDFCKHDKIAWVHLACIGVKSFDTSFADVFNWICDNCKTYSDSICCELKAVKEYSKDLCCELNAVKDNSKILLERIEELTEKVEAIRLTTETSNNDVKELISDAVTEVVAAVQPADSGHAALPDQPDETWATVVKRKKRTQKKNTMVVKSDDNITQDDFKNKLGEALQNVASNSVKFTEGRAFISFASDVAAEEAASKIEELDNVTTSTGKMIYPKITICNVHSHRTYDKETADDFVDHIILKNPYLNGIDDVKNKMEFILRRQAISETHHYILKVAPEVRELIHKKGDKLFIGFGTSKVRDRYHVTICYHCQGYRHVSANCPNSQKDRTCPKCMGNHNMADCRANDVDMKCVNCSRSGKTSDHRANSRDCPSLLEEVKKLKEKTQNGY